MKSEKDKYIEERYAEYQKKWAENPPPTSRTHSRYRA